ncbi:hypothetical protein [Streptomyces sp. NPDC050287]|uniref:hypothetical protein n=1 Tax=Streptomyces sp. NPDC050287 TaxID=3365608 RepID=UPI003795EDB7
MNPAPARVLRVCVLTLGGLLVTAACSVLSTPPTAEKPDYAPATTPPGTSAPSPAALTQAQAQAALVTEADLGEPWTPTQGTAIWHDGLLKATTELPDCRRLLDTLYAEEPFGADARPRAVISLDDVWNEAQLRYQIVTRNPADVDHAIAWLRTLPRKCARFTATTARGDRLDVQVTDAALPAVGDARQGLRVTLTGATLNDEPVLLTLDTAVVRVGDDAIGLSHGGLGDIEPDVTQTAAQLGAQRLADIRKQGRTQI